MKDRQWGNAMISLKLLLYNNIYLFCKKNKLTILKLVSTLLFIFSLNDISLIKKNYPIVETVKFSLSRKQSKIGRLFYFKYCKHTKNVNNIMEKLS